MQKRVALWDNLKLLLIILVVVGHLVDNYTLLYPTYRSLFLFIYAFHMPLFIFVSGLFQSNKNILSKTLFYVSAGFLLKILNTIQLIMLGQTPTFSLLSDGGLPWFMFVLAFYNLLLYVLRNQNKLIILIVAVLVACFVGFDQTIGDYLYLSRIVIFLPFYVLGTMINPDKLVEIKSKCKWLIAVGVVIIAIWAVLCWSDIENLYSLRYFFTGRNHFEPVELLWPPLTRLLCYAISVLTGAALIFIVPNVNLGFVTKMGSRTIDVFFWHCFIYAAITCFVSFDNLVQTTSGRLLYILFAVVLALVLSLGGPFSYPLKPVKKLCFKTKPKE